MYFDILKINKSACLLIADPEREFLDKIEDLNLPWLAKCILFSTLFKEFARYSDKTSLLNEFQLFFTDARIYKMLAKPLGKYFYSQKKFPFAVQFSDLQGLELEQTLNGLLQQTYLHVRNGPNYSFRVARTSMSAKEATENVVSAVQHALPHLLMRDGIKPTRVQSISLRTSGSMDLPVFTQLMSSKVVIYNFYLSWCYILKSLYYFNFFYIISIYFIFKF